MLMREVDDAVRQDQASNFAKKYGLALGIGLLVGLAAFGGYLWWSSNNESQMERNSEELVAAMDELDAGNLDVADDELGPLAEDGSPASVAAARMLRAGIAVEQGRSEEAVALFEQVATDADAPQPMRDAATLRSVTLQFDTMAPDQVVSRLGPLAVAGNPWFGSAGELVAMAYLEQGKEDEAGPLLASIATDEDVPQTIRTRTRQLAGILGYDAVEDVEATLAEVSQGQGSGPAAPQQPAQ